MWEKAPNRSESASHTFLLPRGRSLVESHCDSLSNNIFNSFNSYLFEMHSRRGSVGGGSGATSVTSHPATCLSGAPLAGRDVDKLLLGSVPEQRPLLLAGTGAGGGRRGSNAGMRDMSTFMARAFGGGVTAEEVDAARAARASSYTGSRDRDGSLPSPAPTGDPSFASPAAGTTASQSGGAAGAGRSRRASLGASVTTMDLAADPVAEEAAALRRHRDMASRMWGAVDARVETRRDPTSAAAVTIAASAARRASFTPPPLPMSPPRAAPLRRRTGRGGGGSTADIDAAADESRSSRRARRAAALSRPSGSSWSAGSLDLPPQYGRDVESAEQEIDAADAAAAAVAAAEAAAAAGGASGIAAAALLEALDARVGEAQDRLQLLRAEEIAAARAVQARCPSPKYTLRSAAAPSLHLRDGGGLVQLLGIDVDGAVAAVDAAYAAAHAAQMAAVYSSSSSSSGTSTAASGRAAGAGSAGEPATPAGSESADDASTLDAAPAPSARISGSDRAAALDTLWQLERRQPLHILLCGPAFGLDFAEAPPTISGAFSNAFGSAACAGGGAGAGVDAAGLQSMVWWAGDAQRALADASRALAGHATALLLNDAPVSASSDPTVTAPGASKDATADAEGRAAWAQRSVEAATAAVTAGAADGRVLRFSNTVVQSVSAASPWHGIISAGDPLVGIDGELDCRLGRITEQTARCALLASVRSIILLGLLPDQLGPAISPSPSFRCSRPRVPPGLREGSAAGAPGRLRRLGSLTSPADLPRLARCPDSSPDRAAGGAAARVAHHHPAAGLRVRRRGCVAGRGLQSRVLETASSRERRTCATTAIYLCLCYSHLAVLLSESAGPKRDPAPLHSDAAAREIARRTARPAWAMPLRRADPPLPGGGAFPSTADVGFGE